MAETIFAACALNPPMLPAIAEPSKFLVRFKSTKAFDVVFKTDFIISAFRVASHTTDLPRPSILELKALNSIIITG